MNLSIPSFYAILHTPPLLDASDPRLVSFVKSTFQPLPLTNQTNSIYKEKCQELTNYLTQHGQSVNKHSLQLLFKILIQEEVKLTPNDYSFRQVITNYLFERIAQLEKDTSYSWVLLFLHQECLDFIQQQDKIKLLGLCFKLRSSIGYDNLEHYHVLYNLQKDLHLPSCAWEQEILVNCQDKQRQCHVESMLNHWITCPSTISLEDWIQTFPDNKQPLPSSIQTMLKLHTATYPLEMNGYYQSLTSKGYCLPQKLTLGLTDLIAQISLSPLPLELSHMVGDTSYHLRMHKEESSISLDAVLLENIRSTVDVHDQVDIGMMKECALILKDTPGGRYLSYLTLLLIKMAGSHPTLCLPYYVQAIAQKVNETLYLNDPCAGPVVELTSLVLHFVVFCQCTDVVKTEEDFDRIWNHYHLQRSLYNQVVVPDEDILLPLVKTLISLC
ncbi:hypothetical protein BC941DRAFT_433697 [Chlamydoabsidia padenii]|nr:hypothetical protein BC941DRAFT_433697 [Chlamydoabsidia padenii]